MQIGRVIYGYNLRNDKIHIRLLRAFLEKSIDRRIEHLF